MGRDSYSAVQVVAGYLRRTRFTAGEVALSEDDQYNLTVAFQEAYCLLVDLLPVGDPGIHSFGCFLTGTQAIDVLKVAKSLKGYSDLLISKVTTFTGEGPLLTLLDFKHLAVTAGLYMGLVTPVATILNACEHEFTISRFRALYQWFEFLRHVNVKSLDLRAENEKSYLAFESLISSWSYQVVDCDELSVILSEWTAEFACDDLRPCHGPGAVSGMKGRLGQGIKDISLETDVRLDYFLSRTAPVFPYFPTPPSPTLVRQNEIVFVPKKMDANRVISKEPSTLAYFQQGVLRALQATVFSCAPLKDHVKLSNQAVSQDYAWEGSVTGGFATLDLSNASDSVTLTLVKRCIKNPALRRALICTRSDQARMPSGTQISLLKFAPMGSAVCFPIETLIFAAICELAVRKVSGHTSQSDDYVVYGDDIVIRTTYVPVCLELLSRFHFTVNESKSFHTCGCYRFREACGAYFLNGEDVTPLRLSRRLALMSPERRDHQIGPRVSLIALCNSLLQRGFINARLCALSKLKDYYPGLRGIPFTRLEDAEVPFALQTYAYSCTNVNLRKWSHIPVSREWWGSSLYEVQDVQARADAKLIASSGTNTAALEWARWYEYWKARTYDQIDTSRLGYGDYTPIMGVVFAPESTEIRPQRTYDVRKWRFLS